MVKFDAGERTLVPSMDQTFKKYERPVSRVKSENENIQVRPHKTVLNYGT